MSYIKLDRKMLKWGWISEPSVVALWVYILLNANFKKNVWQSMTIDEGELITSVARLSMDTGLSTQQTRTALKKLVSTNEITCKTTNKYTLIHVNKWSKYQTDNKQTTSESTNETTFDVTSQPTSHVTTLKESKESKESKEKEIYKESLDCSPEFAKALKDFEEMRKKIHKPLTGRAKQMVLEKLSELAVDEETQIAILNQSTMNSWLGVFPLQQQKERGGMSIDIMNL